MVSKTCSGEWSSKRLRDLMKICQTLFVDLSTFSLLAFWMDANPHLSMNRSATGSYNLLIFVQSQWIFWKSNEKAIFTGKKLAHPRRIPFKVPTGKILLLLETPSSSTRCETQSNSTKQLWMAGRAQVIVVARQTAVLPQQRGATWWHYWRANWPMYVYIYNIIYTQREREDCKRWQTTISPTRTNLQDTKPWNVPCPRQCFQHTPCLETIFRAG